MTNIPIPLLAEGEIYGGHYSNAEGETVHFVILPGDHDEASWEEQLDWAKSIGGDLPNRIEQSIMWANHRNRFKNDWYWSNDNLNGSFAWIQLFYNGIQVRNRKLSDLRARAVRRVVVSSTN